MPVKDYNSAYCHIKTFKRQMTIEMSHHSWPLSQKAMTFLLKNSLYFYITSFGNKITCKSTCDGKILIPISHIFLPMVPCNRKYTDLRLRNQLLIFKIFKIIMQDIKHGRHFDFDFNIFQNQHKNYKWAIYMVQTIDNKQKYHRNMNNKRFYQKPYC